MADTSAIMAVRYGSCTGPAPTCVSRFFVFFVQTSYFYKGCQKVTLRGTMKVVWGSSGTAGACGLASSAAAAAVASGVVASAGRTCWHRKTSSNWPAVRNTAETDACADALGLSCKAPS